MKLTFTTAFVDAGAAWRRDSNVLLPLAGITMFLPQYAVLLLVPPLSAALPDGAAPSVTVSGGPAELARQQAIADAFSGWLAQHGGWYALMSVIGLFGAVSVMALYLAPGRPSLGQAMTRAAALVPRYLLASILIFFAAIAPLLPGAMLLSGLAIAALMPLAFYVLGRTMLAGPAIVGDAPIGALAAIRRSWALTRGHGWLLGATYAAPLFAAQTIAGALLTLSDLGGANPVIAGIVDGLAALVMMIYGLTIALVEVTLYRRLANRGT